MSIRTRTSGITFEVAPPPLGLDAATIAWINAVLGNGGSVSSSRQVIVNNLIVSLKNAGIWVQLDRLWLFAAENAPSARTDLVGLSLATEIGSPPFTADDGYTGEDLSDPTNYLDSNAAQDGLSLYTQNDAHISIWQIGNSASVNGGCIFGLAGNVGATQANIFNTFTDGNLYFRVNDTSGGQGAPASREGHWINTRTGAATNDIYRNATLFSSPNAASTALSAENFYITATNNNGAVKFGNPNQIAMASLGGGLTGTEVTDFYNALRIYMTAVGVP